MAISVKERKLSRLGSKGASGGGGGGGSFGMRGHRAAVGTQRWLFAAFFAFLYVGAVVFGMVHVIGDAASFRLVLKTTWTSATLNDVSLERGAAQTGIIDADTVLPSVQIQHAVALPNRVLLTLREDSLLLASGQFECLYSLAARRNRSSVANMDAT